MVRNRNRHAKKSPVPPPPPPPGTEKELSDVSDPEVSPPHNEINSIKMSTNEGVIHLTNKNPVTYHKTSQYDLSLADKNDVWHLIVVHHHKNKAYTKAQILASLFEIVSDSEFYPVGYRQAKGEDFFFIRLCRGAVSKLFKQVLQIRMHDGDFLFLTMKMCVAKFNQGQIYPSAKILQACMDRFNDLIEMDGITRILNLDNLSASPELNEIIINLGNAAALELLITTLNQNKELLNSINGLKLSNNNIKKLTYFELLPRTTLQLIDLRFNSIQVVHQLKFLDKLTCTELCIEGNPLQTKPGYIDEIKKMYPALKKIDGKHTRPLLQSQLHIDSGENTIEVIFQGDIITGDDIQKVFFKKYKTSDMWHQVIIHHEGKFSKSQLLSALFNHMTTHEFYPCYYKSDSKRDSFFIRNCAEQMEILFNAKMLLNVLPTNESIKLTYKMNVANYKKGQLNPDERISQTIGSCFNFMDKLYNLERFSNNAELENIEIYLSNPRTMTYILLQGARRFLSNIEVLKLGNNGIKTVKGMHPLNWMKTLKSIDLSNNLIEDLSEIETIPKTSVTEVWLEGNPLCKKIDIPTDYVTKVKKVFPELTRLDGEYLSLDGCSVNQTNFLCSPDGYDLVEQFINHYFTLYDSLNRQNLKGIYCENAIMTISSNFSGISKSNETQIRAYIDRSRNLLKMLPSYLTKCYVGPDAIISVWKSFGHCEHDFKNFSIDLVSYTATSAVIIVNGIFKELGATLNEEELIIGFVRTFHIKLAASRLGMFGRSSEYKIHNEQVLFYRPSIAQTKNAFKFSEIVNLDEEFKPTDEDKEGMIIIFQELTSLSPIWCARCLKQSSWNFKSALELFVHLCQENKLPEHAFKFAKT